MKKIFKDEKGIEFTSRWLKDVTYVCPGCNMGFKTMTKYCPECGKKLVKEKDPKPEGDKSENS